MPRCSARRARGLQEAQKLLLALNEQILTRSESKLRSAAELYTG